jgi:hypothetical protein
MKNLETRKKALRDLLIDMAVLKAKILTYENSYYASLTTIDDQRAFQELVDSVAAELQFVEGEAIRTIRLAEVVNKIQRLAAEYNLVVDIRPPVELRS